MKQENFIAARQQHSSRKQISPLRVPKGRFGRNDNVAPGWVWLVSVVVLVVGIAHPTEIFAAGQFKIDWHTIDGGGGTSNGGSYTLTGTIGQPDAGWGEGGNYELLGGFWSGGAVCIVDFGELASFSDNWLETGAGIKADLNENQKVDFIDYSILADSWLKQCPW